MNLNWIKKNSEFIWIFWFNKCNESLKETSNHNYSYFKHWVVVHAPKFFIVHKESKLLITIIQIYYPLHVDVVMIAIQQTCKNPKFVIRKWEVTIIVQGIELPLVDLYYSQKITNENILLRWNDNDYMRR